ncbi:MAG TPA: PepSY domain-containing protein [Steroidobacteraceae bacterium]|jgi:uncharacterized membrane protein YkoI
MKAVWTWVVTAAALVPSAGTLAVRAHDAPEAPSQTVILRPAQRHPSLSLAQAVRLAQHRFRARVVRAETQTQGDRTIYLLRMLDDAGRVFAVRVDAASGSIL